jgi:hypothetical protein
MYPQYKKLENPLISLAETDETPVANTSLVDELQTKQDENSLAGLQNEDAKFAKNETLSFGIVLMGLFLIAPLVELITANSLGQYFNLFFVNVVLFFVITYIFNVFLAAFIAGISRFAVSTCRIFIVCTLAFLWIVQHAQNVAASQLSDLVYIETFVFTIFLIIQERYVDTYRRKSDALWKATPTYEIIKNGFNELSTQFMSPQYQWSHRNQVERDAKRILFLANLIDGSFYRFYPKEAGKRETYKKKTQLLAEWIKTNILGGVYASTETSHGLVVANLHKLCDALQNDTWGDLLLSNDLDKRRNRLLDWLVKKPVRRAITLGGFLLLWKIFSPMMTAPIQDIFTFVVAISVLTLVTSLLDDSDRERVLITDYLKAGIKRILGNSGETK